MALLDDDQHAPPPAAAEASPLRKLLPLTTVLMVIAALYAAYTVYSRYSANKQAIADAEAKQQDSERTRNQAITQNGELTFTTFYASDGVIRRGESTRLCYGVMNAKTLKIDPPVEPNIQPTDRHCADISPVKTTTYTITADDGAGHTKTSSLTVRVR